MRALIKKYPDNSTKAKQEIMLEPFPECVQADLDDYLDNYHYALCDSVPDTPVGEEEDARMMPSHYTVEAYQYKPSEEAEEITRYKATFTE